MRINKIKYISVKGPKTQSILKTLNCDSKIIYKTLEFLNVEELNSFIGELLTLKQKYIKECISYENQNNEEKGIKEEKEFKQYERYIRKI